MGARQPGGAGADDGDFLAGRRGALEGLFAGFEEQVGGVALEEPDRDRFGFLGIAHAGFFAQFFDRTYPRAGTAENIGFENIERGAADIVRRYLANEGGNVDPRRTGFDARRIVAEVASAGFNQGPSAVERNFRVGPEPGGIGCCVEASGGDVALFCHGSLPTKTQYQHVAGRLCQSKRR